MRVPLIKSALLKPCVVLCGIVAGLLLIEAACKIHDVYASHKLLMAAQLISRPSDIPGIRYELIPGVVASTPGSPYAIRVNHLGFRGPDVDPGKSPDRIRIVILGDSISFGRKYDEQDLYPSIIRQRPASTLPDQDIEIINASMTRARHPGNKGFAGETYRPAFARPGRPENLSQ